MSAVATRSAAVTYAELEKKYPRRPCELFQVGGNGTAGIYLRALKARINQLAPTQIADIAALICDATTIWDDEVLPNMVTMHTLSTALRRIDEDVYFLHRQYQKALNEERQSHELWGLYGLIMLRCHSCGGVMEHNYGVCPACKAKGTKP
jgi:hypothetical protein